MSEIKKVELVEETLEGVAGGGIVDDIKETAEKVRNTAADTLDFVSDVIRPKKDGGSSGGGGSYGGGGSTGGGTPTQTTSEPPVTPTANPGGPNYNNDNRGGKQMNVQMGKNINSSSGNSM